MKYAIPILALLLLLSSCVSQAERVPDITVDRDSRKYTAGAAEVQLNVAFSIGGLRKFDVDVSYYPYDDLVCLEYRVDFVKHYLFMDRDGREAFVTALENYKYDYELRNLTDKRSKAKQAYGTARSLLIWEAFKYSGEGRSNPVLKLGYYFVRNSPYFAITMPETRNISKITGDKTPNSAMQIFYFTRAQADILAALFDLDYLRGLGAPGVTGGAADVEEAY
jgi:hypothetical protein